MSEQASPISPISRSTNAASVAEADGIRPITTLVHHRKVEEIFRRFSRGSVLDASCGRGALTVRLSALGFDVSCSDIQPELCEIPDKEVRRADLNHSLPYDDESFEYVACINVLHRLYGLDRAVAEIARVLKPGGRAVLSFPNFSNVSRRLRFLFVGTISNSVNTQETVHVTDLPEANFRNCLFFPQVATSVEGNGMRIESVELDRPKKSTRWLAPLGWLIRAIGGLWELSASESKRRKLMIHHANAKTVLLGGPHIVVVVRKS